jgi:hypothetical protein
MAAYDEIKKLLRQAEAHADKDELAEADACVRECVKYGVTSQDISHNLTRGTLRKLRDFSKRKEIN